MKKKVLIDLDVVTVALMKKRDYRKKTAENFLEMVKQKKFECLTPLPLVERIAARRDAELKEEIFEFYVRHTEILKTSKIHEKAESMNIKEEKVLVELEKNGIKSEDALLVLVTSLFKIDYLVSFNKKHLKNKEKIINKILKENRLPEIKIINPYEDLDFLESQSTYSFVKLPFILSASFIGSVSLFTLLTDIIFNTEKYKPFFESAHKKFFTLSFKFHDVNSLKVFSTLLIFLVLLPLAFSQPQSHPLSQITPIDVNLNMFGFNITNVTFVGINLTNPQYVLDVAGDVRWSGSLRGGSVPWSLLTDYSLNVPWSGLLGWGNLTGYNLNVNWIGKLAWGNLTNYPSIITQIGSGLNVSTQSLANNVILGVNFTEVQKRITGSCSGSNAIQVINADGTVVCVDINLYGNVTGRGTPYFIPMWQTSSSITDSLINQTNGNIWITSGNLNIVSGVLQIGGTNVIDSSRNILNVNWVNASYLNVSAGFVVLPNGNVGIGTTNPGYKLDVAGDIRATGAVYSTNGYYIGSYLIIDSNRNLVGINQVNQNLNFGSSYSIYNANWVNATNLNASNTVYATVIRGATIYQGSNQVIDTINTNAPINISGSGNSRIIGLSYDNNFTLVGSSLSLGNTGVTAGTYGSASQVAQFTVNAQGRITSASNVSIAIDAGQITSGILPLVRGGTGADLSTAGNYIIVKSGNSLNASPVDLASGNFTGVLPASKGGTGISGAGGVANRVLLTTDGSTWQAGLVNLANMVTGVLPVSYGGTGASDANTARVNLNAAMAGTCPSGYAVQNATTGSLQCIPVATPSSANVTGAGSPGQIAFWVGSTTLSGDGNLIWDNSAKRLGISVSSPQAKLHVSGDVIIDV